MKKNTLSHASCIAAASNKTSIFSYCATILSNTIARSHTDFLFRNKMLLFTKWRQKPTTCPIVRYLSVVDMEKSNLTNFKNSCKILEIATTIIFRSGDGENQRALWASSWMNVCLGLCFKMGLNANPVIWKWVWLAWKWNCRWQSYEWFCT